MTIDEQVREYMEGFQYAVANMTAPTHMKPWPPPDYQRGFTAGRASYLDAERIERERLEWCPNCDGEGAIWYGPTRRDKPMSELCPTCHGTGRRA